MRSCVVVKQARRSASEKPRVMCSNSEKISENVCAGCRPGSCWRTCALGAEQRDRRAPPRACAHVAQAGDLHRHVRARGERGHGATPAAKLVVEGKPVWFSTMVVSGKSAGEARRLAELAPGRLQLEVQAERREARIALAPFRVVHHPGFGLWRMPRTNGWRACASRTPAQSSWCSQACAIATWGSRRLPNSRR
jgi:hypothetical protein